MTAEIARDCPVPEGQEMADVFTETADILAIRRSHGFYHTEKGASCRLKDMIREYRNPPSTISAACFKCGEGVEIRTQEKLASHPCARFGKIEKGNFVLKGTARNGFGDLIVNIGGDMRKIKMKPTLKAKDCSVGDAANHLLNAIHKDEYEHEPEKAAIASVGICHGCGYSVECSVSANRLKPTEKPNS